MKTNSYLEKIFVKKVLESQDLISVNTNGFYNNTLKSGYAYF